MSAEETQLLFFLKCPYNLPLTAALGRTVVYHVNIAVEDCPKTFVDATYILTCFSHHYLLAKKNGQKELSYTVLPLQFN